MALSKSGKSGSNVKHIDDARRKRSKPPATTSVAPEQATETSTSQTDKPAQELPRVSNRRFDKVKVARIKAAIDNGKYEINYLNVADKFIEHERYA